MARRAILFIMLMVFVLSTIAPCIAYAGWKENYRTKYSKQQVDPNSERAKKIRQLCNIDLAFTKLKRTPKERAKKRTVVKKDQFDGYDSGFVLARDKATKGDTSKTGQTLTGIIKSIGKEVGLKASGETASE